MNSDAPERRPLALALLLIACSLGALTYYQSNRNERALG